MAETVYAVDDPADLDIEKAAFEIFPLFIATSNAVSRKEYASALAEIIGGQGAFKKYVIGNSGDLANLRAHLLGVFRENVRLLLAKTWVEAHDEASKEKSLIALDSLVGMIGKGEYIKALPAFIAVADSIAELLFGEDPRDPGFMEYVFRIEPRLGLFYWYVDRLREQAAPDAELAQMELLIGVFALSSF